MNAENTARAVAAPIGSRYRCLTDDAVSTVSFLMCSEAADRARKP